MGLSGKMDCVWRSFEKQEHFRIYGKLVVVWILRKFLQTRMSGILERNRKNWDGWSNCGRSGNLDNFLQTGILGENGGLENCMKPGKFDGVWKYEEINLVQ